MVIKDDRKKTGLRSYIWLFMAVICIVFSSASKRLIEQKVNPLYYYAPIAFNKKIKDCSRDRHEYLSKVVHAENHQAPDNNFGVVFLFSSLISLALLSLLTGYSRRLTYKEQQSALAGLIPLYLRDHRLQV